MTQVERSEAVKLGQSVLSGLAAAKQLPTLAIMSEESSSSHFHGPKAAAKYALRLQETERLVAVALTSARALVALLEKEAGGEGEGKIAVEGWAWRNGNTYKFALGPPTKAWLGHVRAALLLSAPPAQEGPK